jgi:hypothetical protein
MIAVRRLFERVASTDHRSASKRRTKQQDRPDPRPILHDLQPIAPGRRQRVLRRFDIELVRDCD